MPKRQLLIVKTNGESVGDNPPPLVALGEQRDVLRMLGDNNIAPDVPNGQFYYGPGITIQAPMSGSNDINQLLLSLVDESIAWPVLMRLCPRYGWALMDPESGRVLQLT